MKKQINMQLYIQQIYSAFLWGWVKTPTLHQTQLAAFMDIWKEGAGQRNHEFINYSCDFTNYIKFVVIFYTEGWQNTTAFIWAEKSLVVLRPETSFRVVEVRWLEYRR